MKICIISSYAWIKKANNYGALLQYYALQQFLKQRGHSAFWLRYVIEDNLKVKIKKIIFYFRKYKEVRVHKSFMDFVDKYCCVSNGVYHDNIETLNLIDLQSDFFITGSDQVWGGALEANYLMFVPNNKPKIAYAASFGKDNISVEQANKIRPWIQSFDKVSVREASGVNICKKIGVNALHLIDPTLLLSSEEYPVKSNRKDGKYAFGYILNISGLSDIYWEKIKDIVVDNGWKMKVCAIQGAETYFPINNLVFPTPEEWLAYYRDAEFVFTNTFHGTVFALIYHKNFVSILQKGKGKTQNCRLLSLLEMFDLSDRIWDGETDIFQIKNKPINWVAFEEKRKVMVDKSRDFFKDCNL